MIGTYESVTTISFKQIRVDTCLISSDRWSRSENHESLLLCGNKTALRRQPSIRMPKTWLHNGYAINVKVFCIVCSKQLYSYDHVPLKDRIYFNTYDTTFDPIYKTNPVAILHDSVYAMMCSGDCEKMFKLSPMSYEDYFDVGLYVEDSIKELAKVETFDY